MWISSGNRVKPLRRATVSTLRQGYHPCVTMFVVFVTVSVLKQGTALCVV